MLFNANYFILLKDICKKESENKTKMFRSFLSTLYIMQTPIGYAHVAPYANTRVLR